MSNEQNDKPRKLPTRRVSVVKIVTPTDAVNLTLSVMPDMQRVRLVEEVGKRLKQAEREAWRKRNSDPMYVLTNGRYRTKPVSEMSDAEVDEAMKWDAIAARQTPPPTIQATRLQSPYNISERERHMLGYYTDAERERAAKLNLMRSNTVFGNVMPNFGALFAYNNPKAEFDAFNGTVDYASQILEPIVFSGINESIRTIGNAIKIARTAKNVGLATYNAAKTVMPVIGRYVTNPRTVAASLALGATTAPAFANYTKKEEEGGGFGDLVISALPYVLTALPVGYGGYRLGKHIGKKKAAKSSSTPKTTTATQFYGYDPETRPSGWLFAWENPKGARSRFDKKHPKTEVINEWNSALDDESKKAFKDKYKLYTEKEGGGRDYLDDKLVMHLLSGLSDVTIPSTFIAPTFNPYENKVWIDATPNLVREARWRNAGRALNWGIVGASGYGLYNIFSGSPTNDSTTVTNDSTSVNKPDTKVKSDTKANPDTILITSIKKPTAK